MTANSFAAAFDAIEIDPARAPSPAAIEAALAMCAPADAPGFTLLDDCGGRFVVDREWGLISLRDEALLERERGEVRTVALKVVEPSGASYELRLKLRISGRIPQVIASAEEAAPLAPPLPLLNWPHFTAFAGASAAPLLRDEGDAFAIFAAPIKDPPCALEAALWLAAAPPLPSSRPATWPI